MADVVSTESLEVSRPSTLKAFEGKDHYNLPEEVEVGDKEIINGFRDLSSRTKATKVEWSGYLTKDLLGDLSFGYIRQGDEAQAQTVNIRDLTGLNKVFPNQDEYTRAFEATIQSENWHSEQNPLLIFGKDLGSIDPARLPAGVRVIPDVEFVALVHTHIGKDSFSPQDAYMLAEQQFRPDGRPQIPISIVVGPEEIYDSYPNGWKC